MIQLKHILPAPLPAILTLLLLLLTACTQNQQADVCVYGGTASGVVAAYSAQKMGAKVILVEPTNHIGGLTTGGLGFTDIGNKYAVEGIAKQFYRRVGEHYGKFEQWIFEPSAASKVLATYMHGYKILKGQPLTQISKEGATINTITLEDGTVVKAKVFIDCSYEGDLMAAAGVTYRTGREANIEYGEDYDGVQMLDGHQFPDGIDPYIIEGKPESGLLWGISEAPLQAQGSGDTLIQAYNYRICLTDSLENMIPIERPARYDSTHYDLLARLFQKMPNKQNLDDWFIWSMMPNRKTDINNRGPFSTDMIGMNYGYPDGDANQRKAILEAHEDYTKGLLYFFGHDSRVPEQLREQMLRWGYPKDEYVDNGHWTPQLYVREVRRMVGEYVATQADCLGDTKVQDGIAMAAYKMDSHNTQRVVIRKDGMDMVKNEGNVEIGSGLPYPISYRSITPKREECTNLLVPVCLSASHIAYGSIRMEPVFMETGQAAGIAAAISAKEGKQVQAFDYRTIADIFENDPYMDGSQKDIVADDDSIPQTARIGNWRKHPVRGYGRGYLYIDPTDEYTELTFGPVEVPSDGCYAIYSFEHVDKKMPLAQRSHLTITLGEDTFEKVLDRTEWSMLGQAKGEWVQLATKNLKAGENVKVIVDNSLSKDHQLRADAILIVKLR